MNTIQIEQDQNLFSSIIEKAHDGIAYYRAIRNDEGQIIDYWIDYMNESAAKHIKGTRDEYIGQRLLEKFPGNPDSGLFEAFRNTIETGVSCENMFFYPEERNRGWYNNLIIKHADGVIVYFHNVTEKVQLQKKLEKKTKEAETKSIELQEKKTQLEIKSAQLEKLLMEKDILLKETHHRVKNNLQVISSLLNLQSARVHDKRAIEAFEISRQRINAIALIHDKLYREKNFQDINIEAFIHDIINSIESFFAGLNTTVNYIVDAEKINISVNACISLGLILNELLSNSHKHAFPGRTEGTIFISLKRTESSELLLKIEDDGIGFPKGFDVNNAVSLGLTLVTSLSEQLGAKLSLCTDKGACFCLLIPKSALPEEVYS